MELPLLSEIIFLEGIDNYTLIHLKGGEKILTAKTLLRYEERITHFVRISRKHLVNPAYVKLCRTNGHRPHLVLKNGAVLEIAKRRSKIIRF